VQNNCAFIGNGEVFAAICLAMSILRPREGEIIENIFWSLPRRLSVQACDGNEFRVKIVGID